MPCTDMTVVSGPEPYGNIGDVSPEEVHADMSALFDEVGKWGFKGKFLSKVKFNAKAIIKSPVLKATVAGLAVAYPPVGVPAAAALVAANAVIKHTASKDKPKRKLALKLTVNTAKAAKKGDEDAKRGLQVLLVAKRMRKAQRAAFRKRILQSRARGDARKRRRRRRAAPRRIVVRPRSSWVCRPRPIRRGMLLWCDRSGRIRCRMGAWCPARRRWILPKRHKASLKRLVKRRRG